MDNIASSDPANIANSDPQKTYSFTSFSDLVPNLGSLSPSTEGRRGRQPDVEKKREIEKMLEKEKNSATLSVESPSSSMPRTIVEKESAKIITDEVISSIDSEDIHKMMELQQQM